MDDADDGDLESDHVSNLRSETACGIDHMICDNGTVLCDNVPGSVRSLVDIGDAVTKIYFCSSLACACGQGMGTSGGIGVAVVRRIQTENDVLRIQEWMEFLDLGRTDEM